MRMTTRRVEVIEHQPSDRLRGKCPNCGRWMRTRAVKGSDERRVHRHYGWKWNVEKQERAWLPCSGYLYAALPGGTSGN